MTYLDLTEKMLRVFCSAQMQKNPQQKEQSLFPVSRTFITWPTQPEMYYLAMLFVEAFRAQLFASVFVVFSEGTAEDVKSDDGSVLLGSFQAGLIPGKTSFRNEKTSFTLFQIYAYFGHKPFS